MRTLVQRVSRAEVRIGDRVSGQIGRGFLVLVGFTHGDGAEQISAGALRAVQVPVLLLNGRDDPASLATGRLLEVLPNSRAAVCEGDHLSAPWQPSFQETVAEFLQEQWAKRGGLA